MLYFIQLLDAVLFFSCFWNCNSAIQVIILSLPGVLIKNEIALIKALC